MRKLLCLLVFAPALWAQPFRSSPPFSFVDTAANIVAKNCRVGQAPSFATDAAAGLNLYLCTSTNVWTQAGAGGPIGTAGGALVGAYPSPTLRDFVSVKDAAYGAVGDGTTNDTAALQAALNASNNATGKCLLLPPGTYKITAPLTYVTTVTARPGPCLVGMGRYASVIDPQFTTVFADWAATTAFGSQVNIKPSTGNAGGYSFIATIPGTSGGSAPTWTQTVGAVVTDGSVTWQNQGKGNGDAISVDISAINIFPQGARFEHFGIKPTTGTPRHGIYIRGTYQSRIEDVRIQGMAADGIHIQSNNGDSDAAVTTQVINDDLSSNGHCGFNSSNSTGANVSFTALSHNYIQANTICGVMWQGQALTLQNNGIATNGDGNAGSGGLVVPYTIANNANLISIGNDYENNTPRHWDIQALQNASSNNDNFRASSLSFASTNGVQLCNHSLAGACANITFLSSRVSVVSGFNPYTMWQLGGGTATVRGVSFYDVYWNLFDNTGQTRFSAIQGTAGLSDVSPSSKGTSSFFQPQDLSLVNGVNSDIPLSSANYVAGEYSSFRINGPSAAFSITGFAGGWDGRIIYLFNNTSQAMTITPNATSSANNQIQTKGGGTPVFSASLSPLMFIYNGTNHKWILFQTVTQINDLNTASGNYGMGNQRITGLGAPTFGTGDALSEGNAIGAVAAVPSIKSTVYKTATNGQSNASPAANGSAAAGMAVIAAAATTVVVNDTAVTANSEIIVTEDQSLGTALSVTCNTQSLLVVGAPRVTARTAATSFTVGVDVAPTTNPICFSYTIVN